MTAPLHPFPRSDMDALRRDAVRECADLLRSLAISLDEALYRGSDAVAELHLREIVATVKTATSTFREIGREGAQ